MQPYSIDTFSLCRRCTFSVFRRTVVFGRGSMPADLLFIGDAPSKTEDWAGVSFTGPTGRLLEDAMLLAKRMAEVDTIPTYFLTNVCSCRPIDTKDGENRDPTKEEISNCLERLVRTHYDVNPSQVIFLGKMAQISCKRLWPGAVTMNHPNYILRKGGGEAPEFITFARQLAQVFKKVRRQKPCTP